MWRLWRWENSVYRHFPHDPCPFITLAVVNFKYRILFSGPQVHHLSMTRPSPQSLPSCFNPIIESQGSVKLTNLKLERSDTLTYSHRRCAVSIIFLRSPSEPKSMGYLSNPMGFNTLTKVILTASRKIVPLPDIINYQQLFSTYNICSKNVDESGSGAAVFGYLEYNRLGIVGKRCSSWVLIWTDDWRSATWFRPSNGVVALVELAMALGGRMKPMSGIR